MHHRPARRRACAGATAALLLAATAQLSAALAAQQAPAWHETDRGRRITDEGPKPGIAAHIALYPVNRVLDLFDLVSFQFGFGFGVHANVHATRALQAGGGASAVSRLGNDRRGVGICNDAKAEISILPFSAEYFKRQNAFGTFHDYTPGRDLPWLYKKHRDYWGVGGDTTLVLVNVGLEGHLLEAPDAVLGFLGIDVLRDDWPKRSLVTRPVSLRAAAARGITRVVVVPSRVVAERSTHLERAHGLGVYYRRPAAQRFFGLLGSAAVAGQDRRARREFNTYLDRRNFDVHQILLDRIDEALAVRKEWGTITPKDILQTYQKHAVTKAYRGLRVRRLPNYPGLARRHGADAVLDVRVWEWGIWRFRTANVATMRLDVEYKLIAYPQNRVLLNVRLANEAKQKKGMSLVEFARDEGAALIQETRDAAEIVHAKFADFIVETE